MQHSFTVLSVQYTVQYIHNTNCVVYIPYHIICTAHDHFCTRVCAGDCVMRGFDPPQETTVIRKSAPENMDDIPQLKQPQAFSLTWMDDSARPDKALSLWRPIPYPG